MVKNLYTNMLVERLLACMIIQKVCQSVCENDNFKMQKAMGMKLGAWP